MKKLTVVIIAIILVGAGYGVGCYRSRPSEISHLSTKNILEGWIRFLGGDLSKIKIKDNTAKFCIKLDSPGGNWLNIYKSREPVRTAFFEIAGHSYRMGSIRRWENSISPNPCFHITFFEPGRKNYITLFVLVKKDEIEVTLRKTDSYQVQIDSSVSTGLYKCFEKVSNLQGQVDRESDRPGKAEK